MSDEHVNTRIVLKSRPNGLPAIADFAVETAAIPQPGPGEALVEVMWLSVDGFMIARLRVEENYTAGVAIGDVMQAYGIGRVTASNRIDRAIGDIVFGAFGMQQWALDQGSLVGRVLDPAMGPPQSALGILGISGWSAYFGLLDIGQPKAGETVVVSAGTGAVGALVGQIAKLHGCRTIALVGSEKKVRQAIDLYGYDAAIGRHDSDFDAQLKCAAPQGIDVYFDNVGGDLYDRLLPSMAIGGRIVVCGRLATAHLSDTSADVGPRDHNTILVKRLRKRGFLVSDFAARFGEASKTLADWQAKGHIRLAEDVLEGIEQGPAALLRLLSGGNMGKQLIRVAP
jgi:NADPH-dependent curcumin reductase CurA